MAKKSRLDDDRPALVDVSPFSMYLDSSQVIGEMEDEIELRFDDDLPGSIDEPVFVSKLPARQSFAKVTPNRGAVLFIS